MACRGTDKVDGIASAGGRAGLYQHAAGNRRQAKVVTSVIDAGHSLITRCCGGRRVSLEFVSPAPPDRSTSAVPVRPRSVRRAGPLLTARAPTWSANTISATGPDRPVRPLLSAAVRANPRPRRLRGQRITDIAEQVLQKAPDAESARRRVARDASAQSASTMFDHIKQSLHEFGTIRRLHPKTRCPPRRPGRERHRPTPRNQ